MLIVKRFVLVLSTYVPNDDGQWWSWQRQEDRIPIPGAGQQTPSIAVAGFIHGCGKIFQNSCREIENAVHYEKEEILKLERLEIEKAAYNELTGLFSDNAGTIILDGALGAQGALRHQDRLFN